MSLLDKSVTHIIPLEVRGFVERTVAQLIPIAQRFVEKNLSPVQRHVHNR